MYEIINLKVRRVKVRKRYEPQKLGNSGKSLPAASDN